LKTLLSMAGNGGAVPSVVGANTWAEKIGIANNAMTVMGVAVAARSISPA
jgi:hypothetical protein